VALRTLSGLLSVNSKKRYESRHTLLNYLCLKLGFRLYNKNLTWFNDVQYRNVWREFPESNKNIHERRFNLYNLALSVTAVPGDIAECGVFRGAGSFLMLSANKRNDKKLYGFDSFQGLSAPGYSDSVKSKHAFVWQQNDMAVREDVARKNLEKFNGRYQLYRGWIPERFAEIADRRFCMVHIDVDLYEPTLLSARYFYPLLNSGGLMVCDDYGFASCPGAREAFDLVAREYDVSVVHLTTGQGIIFKH